MVHISRISLRNFKSFRRASIPIPPGFTCIVGPNGSGKSNIVDAICFVLGRSSAKSLRAERFSDLIFNGGKKGEPAKEAEVSLYLDNSAREIPINAKEVKITRRIDSKGNSVYLINDRRTTRAEILDLLAMINVNPDGHNIVLQGDITRIIEMNPVERRKIIDEIAGISDYDERKNKALRELKKVEENLNTAKEVFAEIESQLKKLEKEREDAKRYEYLEREIKKNKALVLQSKYLEAKLRLEEVEEEIDRAEKERERFLRHVDVLKHRAKVKQEETEKINAEVVLKEENEHLQIFREVERFRAELKMARHRQAEVEERLKKTGETVEKLETQRRRLREEKLSCEERVKALNGELERLESKIKSLREKIQREYERISDVDEKTKGKREDLARISAEIDELRGKISHLERKHAKIEERIRSNSATEENLRKIISEIKEKVEKTRRELDQVTRILQEGRKKLSDCYARLQIKRDEIEAKNSRYIAVGEKLEVLYREFAKLEAEKKAYEKINREMSFPRAVEEVLRLKDKIPGIYGTISQLGRVKPEYAVALEVAAGRGMQFIVVENEEVARKCIEHLKKNKIGRATFLPLNKLKPVKPSYEAEVVAREAVGLAIDLIEFDEKFRRAFEQVFKSTVVVEDMEFAKPYIGRVRMVTLDGDLLEESGKITGGYYKKKEAFGSFSTEENKLQDLAREIKSLTAEKDRLEVALERARNELESLEAEERTLERDISLNEERNRLKKQELDNLMEELAKREAELSSIRSMLKQEEREREELRQELTKLKKSIEEKLKQRAVIEAELSSLGVDMQIQALRELEKNLRALENERDGKRAEIEHLKARLLQIERESAELEEKLQEDKNSLEELDKELEKRKGEVLEKETRLKDAENREKGIKNEIDRLRARRDFLIAGVKKINQKIEDIKVKVERVSRKIEKLAIEKARIEVNLENLRSSLKEFENFEIELLAPIETEEIEKEIARMEAEKKALEPVNMRAIEDYEIVKEKYDRYELRITKLEREKRAIEELMEEIEQRKKAVFMEVFENIARNFRAIFKRLSGGEAELILDEKKPLEGGLNIQAKPPGKNPQYIELLSGGERTLTALSFILAIQRYQPAPFYVFDEIDMFLDDANVDKIAELIKEASRQAQFIVVSLRDNMMVKADQLFGVSIQDGASKILGVELENVRV